MPLILIRHTETKQNPTVSAHQWQVTEEGKRRCAILAEKLHPYGLDRLISSEEAKAKATAELTAQALGIAWQSAPDFQETKRDTAPYFEKIADFQAAIQVAMQSPDELLFGEETFTEALGRFSKAVEQARSDYPNERIGIVTHGTMMSLYLGYCTGKSAYDFWEQLGMPAYAVLNLADRTLLDFVPHVVEK